MVSEYVDFPALRESIRAQIQGRLMSKWQAEASDNPFAGLGALLATSMVDRAVDAIVTPQMFARRDSEDDVSTSQVQRAIALLQEADVEWKTTSLATFRRPYPDGAEMIVTLRRDGLRWRVIDFKVPELPE